MIYWKAQKEGYMQETKIQWHAAFASAMGRILRGTGMTV